jgi:hypothetical protein
MGGGGREVERNGEWKVNSKRRPTAVPIVYQNLYHDMQEGALLCHLLTSDWRALGTQAPPSVKRQIMQGWDSKGSLLLL